MRRVNLNLQYLDSLDWCRKIVSHSHNYLSSPQDDQCGHKSSVRQIFLASELVPGVEKDKELETELEGVHLRQNSYIKTKIVGGEK